MNKIKRISAVLSAAALLALGGCASTSDNKVGAYFDDAAITAKVKTAIYNESALKVTDISVTTQENVVSLSGSVKSRAERTKAEQVARKVDGVKRVKNELQVK
jgi:osmotically-inducible protein OsmY